MWSTCENVYERDWIVSHSFHISHVKYTWKSMWNWKWTSTAIDVNLYVKPHVKYMWKCVWKGLHCFTPFSHTFHYAKFHTHMKYVREIHVKSSEKHVKGVWKWHIFHTFFHRIFHIHTPSSVNNQSENISLSDKYCICRSSIFSLVQFLFSFVSYSLSYINIKKNKGK